MSFQSIKKNWEGLAQKDAHWAICTHSDKKYGKWNHDEFFQTGEIEISALFRLLEKEGISPPDTEQALDFGCGVGRLSRALAKHFEKVSGIDVSPTMIQKAKDGHSSYHQIQFLLNEQNGLALIESETISFIYSAIVLQHISYPESLQYVIEFLRILKPGGILVFQVPTRDIRKNSLLHRINRFVKIREKLTLLGIGAGFHMEMNSIADAKIQAALKSHDGEILRHFYTNHTDPNFDGHIQLMSKEDCKLFESSMYLVKKNRNATTS